MFLCNWSNCDGTVMMEPTTDSLYRGLIPLVLRFSRKVIYIWFLYRHCVIYKYIYIFKCYRTYLFFTTIFTYIYIFYVYNIYIFIYTICILYIYIYIWNTVHDIFGFHTHTYPLTIYSASGYRFPVGPWSAKISQSLKLSWAIPSFDYPPLKRR